MNFKVIYLLAFAYFVAESMSTSQSAQSAQGTPRRSVLEENIYSQTAADAAHAAAVHAASAHSAAAQSAAEAAAVQAAAASQAAHAAQAAQTAQVVASQY